MERLSDEFRTSIKWSSHLIATCQCGRKHFATKDVNWDEVVLYNLREAAARNDDIHFEHEDKDYIPMAEIGTMVYVEECDCLQLLEVEKFIWVARNEILKYYHKKQNLIEANLRDFKGKLSDVDSTKLNKGITKNDKGNGKDGR